MIKYLIFGMALLLLSCGNSGMKISRGIMIDGKGDIVPIDIISPSDTSSESYYRFTYEKGKLKTLGYYRMGQLTVDPYFGVARINIELSDEWETWSFSDTALQRISCNLGVYSMRHKLEKGRRIQRANYDSLGVLVSDKFGVTQYRYELNRKGWIVRVIRLDVEGEKIRDNQGNLITEYEYDKDGNKISVENIGSSDQFVLNEDGVAIVRMKYDNKHHLVRQSFLGVDEKPTISLTIGGDAVVYQYDSLGRLESEKYLKHEKPIEIHEGVGGILMHLAATDKGAADIIEKMGGYSSALTGVQNAIYAGLNGKLGIQALAYLYRAYGRSEMDPARKRKFMARRAEAYDVGSASQEFLETCPRYNSYIGEQWLKKQIRKMPDVQRLQVIWGLYFVYMEARSHVNPRSARATRVFTGLFSYGSAQVLIRKMLLLSSKQIDQYSKGYSEKRFIYDGDGVKSKEELIDTAGVVVQSVEL